MDLGTLTYERKKTWVWSTLEVNWPNMDCFLRKSSPLKANWFLLMNFFCNISFPAAQNLLGINKAIFLFTLLIDEINFLSFFLQLVNIEWLSVLCQREGRNVREWKDMGPALRTAGSLERPSSTHGRSIRIPRRERCRGSVEWDA